MKKGQRLYSSQISLAAERYRKSWLHDLHEKNLNLMFSFRETMLQNKELETDWHFFPTAQGTVSNDAVHAIISDKLKYRLNCT